MIPDDYRGRDITFLSFRLGETMGLLVLSQPEPRLAVFGPPYKEMVNIDISWKPPTLPPQGIAVLWWLVDASKQTKQFEWLHSRPCGLPLVIVLPPARYIGSTLPLLNHLTALHPRAVLPSGQLTIPSRIRYLLQAAPASFAHAITSYLTRRNLLRNARIRDEIRQIVSLSERVKSVSRLAREMCMSRRTLGRHLAAEGLPVPSHWLQFGRLIRIAALLQSGPSSVRRIAQRGNYPDGFTLSNQMKRLLGLRPTEVRQLLGWEWVVEAWLRNETRRGGLDRDRYYDAIRDYIERPSTSRPENRSP